MAAAAIFTLRRVCLKLTASTSSKTDFISHNITPDDVTRVGRHSMNDICLGSTDTDCLVSRWHAQIRPIHIQNDEVRENASRETSLEHKAMFTIHDSSLNGTYVNDIRVPHGGMKLNQGDMVTFGLIGGHCIAPGQHAPSVNSAEFQYVFEQIANASCQNDVISNNKRISMSSTMSCSSVHISNNSFSDISNEPSNNTVCLCAVHCQSPQMAIPLCPNSRMVSPIVQPLAVRESNLFQVKSELMDFKFSIKNEPGIEGDSINSYSAMTIHSSQRFHNSNGSIERLSGQGFPGTVNPILSSSLSVMMGQDNSLIAHSADEDSSAVDFRKDQSSDLNIIGVITHANRSHSKEMNSSKSAGLTRVADSNSTKGTDDRRSSVGIIKATRKTSPSHTKTTSDRAAPYSMSSRQPSVKRSGGRKSKRRTVIDEDVEHCASIDCQRPTSDLITWVQCDDCDGWYHTVCAGCAQHDTKKLESVEFHCGCN